MTANDIDIDIDMTLQHYTVTLLRAQNGSV